MAGFWSPYETMQEAQSKLCRIADAAGGSGLGVSFSDGRDVCVLRQARRAGGRSMWLNVLVTHAAAPPPPPPARTTLGGKLKAWFWRAMELEGQAQLQQAQTQMVAGQAMAQEFHDHVWEPTHDFLLRHKLVADGAGVFLDAVGVAAGICFIMSFPAIATAAAAGSVVAGVGLATGSLATAGAFLLFGIDGTIFGAEMSGYEAKAKAMEDNATVGWLRIGATIMLLPDLPVGGLRALKEIGQLTGEASEALERGAQARRMTSNANRDLNNVTNPGRHPIEVARQMDRVRKYQAEVVAQAKLLDAANARIKLLYARDLGLVPSSTVDGVGLIAAAPPGVALSEAQKKADEAFIRSITPSKPSSGIQVQMRVIAYGQGS